MRTPALELLCMRVRARVFMGDTSIIGPNYELDELSYWAE